MNTHTLTLPVFKHDYQPVRYRAVLNVVREALGWTFAQVDEALKDGRLPPCANRRTTQRQWLAKDVLAFIARVQQGDATLLGKGPAGGNMTSVASSS